MRRLSARLLFAMFTTILQWFSMKMQCLPCGGHTEHSKQSQPARIAFLRKLGEESVSGTRHAGLHAQPTAYYLNASVMNSIGKQPEEILYYLDFRQSERVASRGDSLPGN